MISEELKLDIYKTILLTQNQNTYKSDYFFDILEENILINEGIKDWAQAFLLAGMASSLMTGCSKEETFQNLPSTQQTRNIVVDQSKYTPQEIIDNISEDIKNYSNKGKEKGKELQSQIKEVSKVLTAAKSQVVDYRKFQDNPYLKSIWITSLFSVDRALYSTIGSQKSGKRVFKFNRDQRWFLFYKHVVHKGKLPTGNNNFFILDDKQKKECQNHKYWDDYEELVDKIGKQARTNSFPVWLTEDLYKMLLKGELGNINIKHDLEKVSWCGVMVAGILSRGGIGVDLKSFASGNRVYHNFLKKEDMVYNHNDYKNMSDEEKANAIKKVLFVGSIVALYPKELSPDAQHFSIVTDISYDKDGKVYYDTIEGNTEGGGGTVYSHKKSIIGKNVKTGKPEIAQILNIKSIFGSAPKSIVLSQNELNKIKRQSSSRGSLPKGLTFKKPTSR